MRGMSVQRCLQAPARSGLLTVLLQYGSATLQCCLTSIRTLLNLSMTVFKSPYSSYLKTGLRQRCDVPTFYIQH